MRVLTTCALGLLMVVSVTGALAAPALKTEEEKTLYAVGVILSRNVQPFEFTDKELKLVQAGLADGVRNKVSGVEADAYIARMKDLQAARMMTAKTRELEAGNAYLGKAATEPGSRKTDSGVVIVTLQAGTGASPADSDQVKVQYEGKLIDGTVFDSSLQRGEAATFPLSGVISCWREALTMMQVGGRSRIVCPPSLAYGDRGSPPKIRPGATLVFDVELLDIVK